MNGNLLFVDGDTLGKVSWANATKWMCYFIEQNCLSEWNQIHRTILEQITVLPATKVNQPRINQWIYPSEYQKLLDFQNSNKNSSSNSIIINGRFHFFLFNHVNHWFSSGVQATTSWEAYRQIIPLFFELLALFLTKLFSNISSFS